MSKRVPALVLDKGDTVVTLKESVEKTPFDIETAVGEPWWPGQSGRSNTVANTTVFTATGGACALLRVFTSRRTAKVKLSLDEIRQLKDWCTAILAKDATQRLAAVSDKEEVG